MALSSNLPHLQDSHYAKHLSKDSKYLNLTHEPKKRGRSRSKSFGGGEGEGGEPIVTIQSAGQRENSTDDDMPDEIEDSPVRINKVEGYNHVEMPKPLDSKQTLESNRAVEKSE